MLHKLYKSLHLQQNCINYIFNKMVKLSKWITVIVLTGLLVASCQKNENLEPDKPETFDITNHYIAGTISPKSDSYKSIYLIKLLADNKAVFMGTGNDLTGSYSLTKDSLIIVVENKDNFRTARFSINEKHELTSAYYRALAMEYKATGTLIKIPEQNMLSGKTYKGEEYKMGPALNKSSWFYKFSSTDLNYGSAEQLSGLETKNQYELINNSAFKYKNGNTTEIGFVVDKQLTVFRSSGLFYFGAYQQQ